MNRWLEPCKSPNHQISGGLLILCGGIVVRHIQGIFELVEWLFAGYTNDRDLILSLRPLYRPWVV